jgi:hypothetical protein
MVYGRYNELVFMGFINQLTSLGGTILYLWIYLHISTYIYHISIVGFPQKNTTFPSSCQGIGHHLQSHL